MQKILGGNRTAGPGPQGRRLHPLTHNAYSCIGKFYCSIVQIQIMKKIITISCLVASLALILDSIGAGRMLMMFLFVGTIPGTNSSLTPAQMLALMSILTSLAIVRIAIMPMIRKFKLVNAKQSKLTVRRLKRA